MRKDNVSNLTKLVFFFLFFVMMLSTTSVWPKSKQYYNLLIQLKNTLPNVVKKLKDKFNIKYEDLSEVYLLPLKVCIETSKRFSV